MGLNIAGIRPGGSDDYPSSPIEGVVVERLNLGVVSDTTTTRTLAERQVGGSDDYVTPASVAISGAMEPAGVSDTALNKISDYRPGGSDDYHT